MSTEIESADDDRISSYVWRKIGKESARDMAKALGVSPDEILRVKRELAESVDALTVDVQRAKLLRSLQELADDAHEMSKSTTAEFYAGTVNASVGAMKTLLVELNRTSKQDSEALNSLNAMRVRELTALMFEVVDATVPLVAERYSIPEDDLFAMFNEALARAATRRDQG